MTSKSLSNGFVIIETKSNGTETIIYGGNQDKGNVSKKPRNTKTSRSRSVIPVFQKMLDIAEKGFWYDLIYEFSVNNIQKSTTRNLHFDGKLLIFNNKSAKSGATLNLEESEKRPIEVLYNELLKFLKKYDIKPAKERKEEDEKIGDIYVKADLSHINSFKKLKNLKTSAIFDFLCEKADKYQMNKKERKLALEKLTFGYTSDILNDHTIIVEEGKITRITNLKWDKKKREFWFKLEDDNGVKTFKMPKLSAKKQENPETNFTSYTSSESKVYQKGYNNPNLSKKLDACLLNLAEKLSEQ